LSKQGVLSQTLLSVYKSDEGVAAFTEWKAQQDAEAQSAPAKEKQAS
jgi:hypothetical protein